MADDTVDVILPILQRIQADVAAIRGQLSAFKDMTEARFTSIEHILLELSARTYVLEQRDGTPHG